MDGGLCSAWRTGFFNACRPDVVELLVSPGGARMAQPCDGVSEELLSYETKVGYRTPLRNRGQRGGGFSVRDLPYGGRSDRLRVPSALGRRCPLGARHARTQHGADRGHKGGESGARHSLFLSGGYAMHESGRTPRRRNGPHWLFRYGILPGPQAQGTVARGLSQKQGTTDRGHGSRGRKNSRRDLGLFSAD